MNLNNLKKLSGDASFRNFYRSKSSIIVYCEKNKKSNLLEYDAINKILIKKEVLAPFLISQNYKKNYIEIQDFCDFNYPDRNPEYCQNDQGQGMREMAYIYPGGNGFAQHSWNSDPPVQSFVHNPSSGLNKEYFKEPIFPQKTPTEFFSVEPPSGQKSLKDLKKN